MDITVYCCRHLIKLSTELSRDNIIFICLQIYLVLKIYNQGQSIYMQQFYCIRNINFTLTTLDIHSFPREIANNMYKTNNILLGGMLGQSFGYWFSWFSTTAYSTSSDEPYFKNSYSLCIFAYTKISNLIYSDIIIRLPLCI